LVALLKRIPIVVDIIDRKSSATSSFTDAGDERKDYDEE
jgi:hypothetical protein